jgi:serine/threonine protein kinase
VNLDNFQNGSSPTLWVYELQLAMEIKLHRTLKHENIVAFHNFYEDEEHYYMILEKCNNKVRMPPRVNRVLYLSKY